jgi:RNA polymerase sigma factor (sigma-70 family)
MGSFAQLVETESRGLVAAATAIVGDAHRAEEIVQSAFERCYRRWSRVSQLDRPGAWVRRVAINEAISVARRSSSERRAVQRVGSQPASHVAATDTMAGVDHDGLWAAVRALPGDQAAAIALRYGADLGINEIADTLQVSATAVKSLLHRGRTALRHSAAITSYTT